MAFLDDYEPVAERIDRFYQDHPTGAIHTHLEPAPAGEWIVRAEVFRVEDGPLAATGLAHEIIGSSPVNKTAALENCETSAIGRALANLNYAAKGRRPSREEMAKVPPPADHITAAKKKVVELVEHHPDPYAAWALSAGLDPQDDVTDAARQLWLTACETLQVDSKGLSEVEASTLVDTVQAWLLKEQKQQNRDAEKERTQEKLPA